MRTLKDKSFLSLVIVFLIVLLLVLIFFTDFGKIRNSRLIPTGNIDVFEIDISCKTPSGTCPVPTPTPDVTPKPVVTPKPEVKPPVSGEDTPIVPDIPQEDEEPEEDKEVLPPFDYVEDEEIFSKLFAGDANGEYIYQEKLNIFNNQAFEYTNKIAPGVSNTYDFIVKNKSQKDFKYFCQFYETTEYKVNLKYRLRKDGEYIIGDEEIWVSADELLTSEIVLAAGEENKYSLDWKWFDDDENDTLAGKNMTSVYRLNIRFFLEENVE